MILEKNNLKIEKLKIKINPSFTKTILCNPNLVAYLVTLCQKYVILSIVKASKIFAFVFKKFYISKILSEMEEYSNIQCNSTYSKNFSKEDFIKNFIKHELELGLLFRKRIVVLNHYQLKFPRFLKCFLKKLKISIIKAHFIQVSKSSGLWRIISQLLKTQYH